MLTRFRQVDGSLATFAIKELKVSVNARSEHPAIIDEWQAEATALEETSSLLHPHIIPVKSIITHGTNAYYFMFEWADEGNLRDMYDRDVRSTLTSQDVKEVIVQLSGVVDATYALHHYQGADASRAGYRHGDLKPENILRMSDSTRMGVWKIGDMGLAKRHRQATRYREQATTTRYTTPRYEPPEVCTQPHAARSRLYDIWSMGCITLELIIWLLYGPTEVIRFNKRLSEPTGYPGPYWVCDDQGKNAKLHPVVLKYTDHIRRDPECRRPMVSALGDLLRLVENQLLVVNLPLETPSRPNSSLARSRDAPEIVISEGFEDQREARRVRATAAEFRTSLTEIYDRGNQRGSMYMFSGRDRKGFSGPSFDDRYSDIADRLDQRASSLRDAAPTSLTNKDVSVVLPNAGDQVT